MKKGLGLIALLLLVLTSCDYEKAEKRKLLGAEVMKVHDEVMPQMADINLHLENIEEELEMISSDTIGADEARIIALKETKTSLELASDGMNNWMMNFKLPSMKVKDDEAIVYLNKELVKITQVAIDMKAAIIKADTLFEGKE